MKKIQIGLGLITLSLLLIISSCNKDPRMLQEAKSNGTTQGGAPMIPANGEILKSPIFELSTTDLAAEDALLNIEATLNYTYARITHAEENPAKRYSNTMTVNVAPGANMKVTDIQLLYDNIVQILTDRSKEAGEGYTLNLVDISAERNRWTIISIFKDPLPADDPSITQPWDISTAGSFNAPTNGGTCSSPGQGYGAPEVLSQYIIHNAMVFNYGILPLSYVANPTVTQDLMLASLPSSFFDPNSPQYWFPANQRKKFFNGLPVYYCINSADMEYYYSSYFYTIIGSRDNCGE